MSELFAHRTLASIFTRPVFRAVAEGRRSSALGNARRLLEELGGSPETLTGLFDAAYMRLFRGYRNEYVYKNTLANKLVFGRHSPSTASLLSEFRVNDSIADAVVINGTSTVYEIKTQYDTLARLPAQLRDYSRVFDQVYVVTHEGAVRAVEALPFPHVGILVLNRRGALQVCREAASNLANLDLPTLFLSLRQSEFTRILSRYDLLPDVGADRFWWASQQAFARLPKDLAHAEAILELRRRTTGAEEVPFLHQLPASLKLLGFAEPCSRPRKRALLTNLQMPLADFAL